MPPRCPFPMRMTLICEYCNYTQRFLSSILESFFSAIFAFFVIGPSQIEAMAVVPSVVVGRNTSRAAAKHVGGWMDYYD